MVCDKQAKTKNIVHDISTSENKMNDNVFINENAINLLSALRHS